MVSRSPSCKAMDRFQGIGGRRNLQVGSFPELLVAAIEQNGDFATYQKARVMNPHGRMLRYGVF